MVRTMISSSSAFGSARARRARSQNQYYCTFGLVFDLSSGDSGLARARCGPFTGSCGRTRALRATWRESVARVTLRWSAERKELPEKPSRGARRARSASARRDAVASPGSNEKQKPTRRTRRSYAPSREDISRSRRESRSRALDGGSLQRRDRACATRVPPPRPATGSARARAADRRAARCESRLVTHRRHGSPVVASTPTRRPADRATTRPRLAQCRAPAQSTTRQRRRALLQSPAAAQYVATLLLLRTFMTACMFSGTRFSAAARFRRGKHDAAASTGHFTPRDSHRVRRASPHPGARASCAFSIHALGPLACDLSFA